MIYFGEGSDWNYETDGDPICICDIEGDHHHTVEELMARDAYYNSLETNEELLVAPDTGEPNIVSGLIGISIVLVMITLISYRKVKNLYVS